MTLTLPKSAAGFALLAVLAAGCGTAVAGHHSAAPPATIHHATAHPAMHAPAPAKAPPAPAKAPPAPAKAPPAPAKASSAPANPIPQGNGGDQDADNNGGPSDGDGNI